MLRIHSLGRILVASALTLAVAGQARADSFLTSVSTGSKTAARVAPAPYTGSVTPVKSGVAARALNVIKQTRNAAIGLDVIQRVDSVAMDNPAVGKAFRLGLAKLARGGDPVFTLLRGTNLVMRSPKSDRAAAAVRKAARELPNDSAAQLVAGLTIAQREAFGRGNWDKPSRLTREAAKMVNAATSIEAKTTHPRPLVREGLKQAKEYMPLYGAYKDALK
jgi:hypothetical protein